MAIVAVLFTVLPSQAQYYDTYADPVTDAAVLSGYATEIGMEGVTEDGIRDSLSILASYKKMAADYAIASVAAAGIYAFKHKAWKAMHDVGQFGKTQSVYFQQMLILVRMITRETLICTYYLAHKPQEFLYWGPYIYETCNECVELCMQFEALVCNMKVHFDPSMFITLSPELAKIADLAKLGKGQTGLDFKSILNEIGNLTVQGINDDITKAEDGVIRDVSGTVNSISNDVMDINGNINTILGALSTLANAGGSVSGGMTGISGKDEFMNLLGNSKLSEAFHSKPQEVINAVNNISSVFTRFANGDIPLLNHVKGYLTEAKDVYDSRGELIRRAGDVALEKIFTNAEFAAQSYLSDYMSQLQDQYYKQKYKVVIKSSGSEVVCNYAPKPGLTGKVNGGADSEEGKRRLYSWTDDWTNYVNPVPGCNSSDPSDFREVGLRDFGGYTKHCDPTKYSFMPTSSQLEKIRRHCESKAGWSRERVNELNSEKGSIYTYGISESLHRESLAFEFKKSNWRHQMRYYFAYYITVTKVWSGEQVYWEKELDTQFDSKPVFENEVKEKEQEAIDFVIDKYGTGPDGGLPAGFSVEVETENPRYYDEPDNASVSQSNVVSFNVNCDSHTKIAEGHLQWAENHHVGESKEVTEKMKKCALERNASGGYEDIDASIDSLNLAYKDRQAQLSGIKNKIAILQQKKNEARNYSERRSIELQIEDLENDSSAIVNQMTQLEAARNQAEADRADEPQTHRIPWLLDDITKQYGVEWTDEINESCWNGNDFIVHGKISKYTGVVTFKGTLKVVSPEEHLFGIRIHRARLCVDWEVYGDQSSSFVAETMTFRNGETDEEKKQKISEKQQQLMEDHPDCSIEVDYGKTDSLDTEDYNQPVHILWMSDRVSLANNIVARMASIYSNLVLLHRFLNDGETLKDFFRREIGLRMSVLSRGSVAQNCISDWIDMAKETTRNLVYNPFGDVVDNRDKQYNIGESNYGGIKTN